MITVRYSSIDGFRKMFGTTDLDRAQLWAQNWIGRHPEIGSTYAVSGDGIGKITVQGCTLAELFPA